MFAGLFCDIKDSLRYMRVSWSRVDTRLVEMLTKNINTELVLPQRVQAHRTVLSLNEQARTHRTRKTKFTTL